MKINIQIWFKAVGIFVLCLVALSGLSLASNPPATQYPRLPESDKAIAEAAEKEIEKAEAAEAEFRKNFRSGYELYSKGKYQKACERLYSFLSAGSPDDHDYEWAEFFFGISLYKLGYTHVAVDTLSNLVARKPNPQIVGYVLELMEKISRTVPFDNEMMIDRAICDQSYGFVEGNVADFVHYYQGEYDWEHGLFSWGDEHFGKIRKDSYYHNKFIFKRALRFIYDDRIDEAISDLKKVIVKTEGGSVLKDDARKTLARLYYESGKFEKADFLYQQIEMNIVEQAQNLLERAWAHYRMGNAERAMGLLYSFEAPSYANSFTPEFYILKSFIYKDVCHYNTAMEVLEQFKVRYGTSLESIYQRQPLRDNNAMLLVLLNKTKIKGVWQFLNLLEREHELAAKESEPNLKAYMELVYTLKRKEVEHRFKVLVNDEYEKMANAMLQFEEEAHLMEYEIGIDMYQRVHDYHVDDEKPKEEKTIDHSKKAIYAFQGEFWNDELDNYEVILPDKCQKAEEWDIFFK
jgi:tetratricopeptide (TPR) repeat protein